MTTSTQKIHYSELKTKTRKMRGEVYEGQVEKGFQAEVAVNESIRIFGTQFNRVTPKEFDMTFVVGGQATYDVFNLVFTGTITKIGAKSVTITERSGVAHQLDICAFARINWNFDAAAAAKHNREWLD